MILLENDVSRELRLGNVGVFADDVIKRVEAGEAELVAVGRRRDEGHANELGEVQHKVVACITSTLCMYVG